MLGRYAKNITINMRSQIQDISHAFRTDSAHQLNKAITAFEHSHLKSRTGFQAKIVVDLYMSVECSLKSLISSQDSFETPEDTLRSILKIGHDLKKLISKAKPTSLTDADKTFIRQLGKKGVSLRYDLDLTALVTSELLRSDYVDFLIDEEYVNRLIEITKKISKEAQDRHKIKFTNAPQVMTKKQVDDEVKALRELLKDVRKKKQKKPCWKFWG